MSSPALGPRALAAVRAAVAHLADRDHPPASCALGHLLRGLVEDPAERTEVIREVRAALGLQPEQPGALAVWAGQKSAPEVAQALEQITKS